MNIVIKKYGVIIDKFSIPSNIDNNNINGPTVFKRPKFFPEGSKWIMYFAHHSGDGIRIAESDHLTHGWKVSNVTILDLKKIPGYGHISSPEVEVLSDRLNLFYHCCYNGGQYTFKAITYDGKNWEYEHKVQGYFYFRLIEKHYAIAKYNNNGGIWYKKENDKFIEQGILLPRMRHSCYSSNKLYWSEIGDSPESIYCGDLNLLDFTITNKHIIIKPTELYEIKGDFQPSSNGSAINVTQVRDPFVIIDESKTFIFYTVCGEEGIAVAEII